LSFWISKIRHFKINSLVDERDQERVVFKTSWFEGKGLV